MQMNVGLHRLAEKIDNVRSWRTEREDERAAWAAETKGATLPALAALTGSLATVRRELEAAAEGTDALERLGRAVDGLGDAPERAGYVRRYETARAALEERLDDDGPVYAAVGAALKLVEPARAEAEAEIARRDLEAAETEAREREDAARREAEERRASAIAEAEAALAVLAGAIPEAGPAPAAADGPAV